MVQRNLDDLQVGEILAADVKDRSGRLLLTAGAAIEERHLKIFRGWGVTDVSIEGTPNDDHNISEKMAQQDPDFRNMVETELKKDFKVNDLSNPFIQALLKICVDRAMVQQTGAAE